MLGFIQQPVLLAHLNQHATNIAAEPRTSDIFWRLLLKPAELQLWDFHSFDKIVSEYIQQNYDSVHGN